MERGFHSKKNFRRVYFVGRKSGKTTTILNNVYKYLGDQIDNIKK